MPNPIQIVLTHSNQNMHSVLPDRFFVQIIRWASLRLKTSVASKMQSAFPRLVLEQKLKLHKAQEAKTNG